MKPTPVLLPGESHGQRSLAGYTGSLWGGKETRLSDWAHTHYTLMGLRSLMLQVRMSLTLCRSVWPLTL